MTPLKLTMLAVIPIVGVICGGLQMAKGQDGHAENHEWLSQLKTKTGYSCCSGDAVHGDCRIARARPRSDGGWEWKPEGSTDWLPVPYEAILSDHLNKNPLHSFICEQAGFVHCFLKGGAGG